MSSDRGSITAELAVVLPTAVATFLFMAQLGSWQLERSQLVVAAGAAARAASHLQTDIEVANLVAKIVPGAGVNITVDAEIVCASVTKSGFVPLTEKICTRVQGQ